MKNVSTLAVAGMVAVMLSGCTTMYNAAPRVYPPLAEVKTTATYDVIGPAEGTSSASYLFWIIPLSGENKSGSIGSSFVPISEYSAVEQAAIYNAIESVPGADALVSPRMSMVRHNYVIFVEDTVTVKGKAIRYNPSTTRTSLAPTAKKAE
jgi:hypothetical protein